jgi:succinate dehydrogenase / fumarate reductase membrane anchor subunit
MYKYNGTGNNGTFAWLFQRVSGIAVAICGTVIFYQLMFSGGHNFNGWLLLPVVIFGLWHTFSGFKMITDDYISCSKIRVVLLTLYWIAGIALFAASLPMIATLGMM